MLGAGRELPDLCRVREDESCTGVLGAVVGLGLGDPVAQRHEAGAEPLAGPVELHRLDMVAEDARDAVAGSDTASGETVRYPGGARAEILVGEALAGADQGFGSRRPLGGVEEARREVHVPPAR